jgi:arylsulfatase A-like enzyme
MALLTRRDVLMGLSGAAAAWLLPGCSRRASPRPHLLLLLSDDQRWDTLGCAGNPIVDTPNLDALARRGVLFRQAFVTTSICPSSRASILTGRCAGSHGVFGFDTAIPFSQMRQIFPVLLRQQGYETAFLGKWGVDAQRRDSLRGAAALYDYWAGASWQDNYWHEAHCRYVVAPGRGGAADDECDCPPDERGVAGPRPRVGRANQREPLHLTTQILPRRFADFLDTRDASRPFCVQVSFKAPHAPVEDWDPRYAERYREVEFPLRQNVAFAPDPALPKVVLESDSAPRNGRGRDAIQAELRGIARHLCGLDFAVGEMLRALSERGLADDTVVMFSSDNGRLLGEHGLWGKWLMYEESIRVPLIVCDPRQGSSLRGRESDAMVLNVDIAPTLCELGGAPVPGDLDGQSLLPLLRGERDSLREAWFYEHRFRTRQNPIPSCEGVRTARWKYVRFVEVEPQREMLFDLESDPAEMRDLAHDPAHVATLRELRASAQRLGGAIRARRPRGRQPGRARRKLPGGQRI